MILFDLEHFLQTTKLQFNPDCTSNLIKTAHSKNITIEEWNTLVSQLSNFNSKNIETYLGFEHTYAGLNSLSNELSKEIEDTKKALEESSEALDTKLTTGLDTKYDKYPHIPDDLFGFLGVRHYIPATIFKGEIGSITKTVDWTEGTYDVIPNTIATRDINGRMRVEDPDDNISNNPKQVVNVSYLNKRLDNYQLIVLVQTLPENGLNNRIYLVPKSYGQNNDLFDEYMYVNGKWEWITTKQLEIDLTPYATIGFVNSKVDINETELDTMLKEVLV